MISTPAERSIMSNDVPASFFQLVPVSHENISICIPFIRGFYDHFKYPFDLKRKQEVLAAFVSDPSLGRICFIQHGQQPIGYVIVAFSFGLEFNGRVAFIDELYIEPAQRAGGIGAQTLGKIEQLCIALDVRAIRLEVEIENERASSLYIRSGYELHNRHILTKRLNSF